MAVYKLFPKQDATLYSEYPATNTGIDEILEIGCSQAADSSLQVSRALLLFSSDEIANVVAPLTTQWDAYLKLYMARVVGLGSTQEIECYPLSASWDNGLGKFADSPANESGVSWTYTVDSGSGAWPTTYTGASTGSYLTGNPGGGVWMTAAGYKASASFGYRSNFDINFKVTSTVLDWNTAGIVNNGFILKQKNEFTTTNKSLFQYFSVDTNTIYPPCLEIRWEDVVYNTGSLSVINSDQVVVDVENNGAVFYADSVQRFRLSARPQFPTRTFQTSSIYTNNYALPANTYYSILDQATNDVVVDFDTNYTKVSCDSNGSYFDLYMNGFQPERTYKIQLKTTIGASTKILDNKYYFKIVNG